MTALLLLQLTVLSLSALSVAVLPGCILWRHRQWSASAVAAWALGLCLFIV